MYEYGCVNLFVRAVEEDVFALCKAVVVCLRWQTVHGRERLIARVIISV